MPEVVMPRLSDTMEEGTLSQWLKNVGDPVHKGDVLAEIETDKATMDLEAFEDGVLEQQLVPASAEPASAEPAEAPPGEPGTTAPQPSAPALKATELRTSPLARKIAHDHNIDLATIGGSGPQGRITRADVEDAIAQGETAPAAAARGAQARVSQPSLAATPTTAEDADGVIPLGIIRRVTARRLTESQAVPHFFLTSVVEVERLIAFRAEVNAGLAELGTKVSINDLFVRACAVALRAHPEVNASWGGDTLLRHGPINIGIAVATDDGLVVPV